jgi:glycosyltransferase Alg8
MLYTQWLGALIKIDAYHDLANQKWSKGGEVQSSDINTDMIKHPLVKVIPKVVKYSSLTAFIFILMLSHGVFYIPKLNAFNHVKYEKIKYNENEQIVDLRKLGVGVKGCTDNAKIINNIIDSFKGSSLILQLPEGHIDIYEPIVINKSNIIFKGKGKSRTIIISHLKKPHIAAIQVLGSKFKKIGYLSENIIKDGSIFKLDLNKNKIPAQYLLIREPNSKKFLNTLGAKKWNKKYPYLRQQIVKVARYNPKEHLVYTAKPLLVDLSANFTEVYSLDIVENVHLKDFSVTQIVPDADINEYSFVYENKLPDFQVDAVRFDYASYSSIENVKIKNAGRHALVFENCYSVLADGLTIDGSWNKGKGGSGYLRVARTYHSEIKNSEIFNIRHLALQWSSAKNHIHDLNMSVDINLHGGYTHDNQIDNIVFFIPKLHHWSAIEQTPNDAKWAPPDGKNFIDNKTIAIRK